MSTLRELIEQLPPDLQQEVLDFASFLLEKRLGKRGRPLQQDWAGGLSDLREQYTSVEL